MLHGGEYGQDISIDFSVNLHPLGMPKQVKEALRQAVGCADRYPDRRSSELRERIALRNHISSDMVVMGNGASESIMAIVKMLRPRHALLIEPCFYGYRHALLAEGCQIHTLQKKWGDFNANQICEALTEEIELLFLNDPVNPTGENIEETDLFEILKTAKEKKIKVVLDESFYPLSDKVLKPSQRDLKAFLEEYDNVFILQSYTKLFAIPGVRIGFVLTNEVKARNLQKHMPEWNLSCFAQAGGIACEELWLADYPRKTYLQIQKDRETFQKSLREIGYKVWPSNTIFFLLKGDVDLGERLLSHKIAVRDCSNFQGLDKGMYRIAVKTSQENNVLVQVLEKISRENKQRK